MTLRKNVKRIEKIATAFIPNTQKKVFQSLFYEIEKNSHVNEVGVVFFTEDFSNKKICFASLIFNQIHNTFHFHEVFSQNSFKTFMEKINKLKGWLGKCKKYSGMCTQHVP